MGRTPTGQLGTVIARNAIALGLALGGLLTPGLQAAEVELSPCTLTAAGGRQEVDAQCATLAVALDPGERDGETIDLFVAVVDALAEQGAPDPLVVIAGGPGQAATSFYAAAEGAFARVVRKRDIVLVDQRGTGRSAPLTCEGGEDDLYLETGDVERMIDANRECLEGLAHDPRYFTTSVAVRDLERVRQALGYAEVNLYGISYGTRVAQHYLRRYPERTRRVVLDGVLPPGVSLAADVALASQAALDALFDRCEGNAGCRQAFSDLRSRFTAVVDRLRETPVEATLDHPRTGDPVDVVVDHWMLVGVVRLLVYQPQTASLLPYLIDAVDRGDYRALATQVLLLTEGLEGFAVGLNNAVMCTEDAPYEADVDLEAQAATYMGTALVEVMAGTCAFWPRGLMDDDLHDAVTSDRPVLMLSGGLDPITPPRYARRAATGLANVIDVVAPDQGHGILMTACGQRLAAEFLDIDDARTLDRSCVDRMRPAPIFTSRMGPGP